MSENNTVTVTVTLSRASAKSWLGDLRETVGMCAYMHEKNPNYPTLAGYFEEFPHVKEAIDALESALGSAAVAVEGATK